MRKVAVFLLLVVLAGAGSLIPLESHLEDAPAAAGPVPGPDLSRFSPEKPERPLRLLFIHHSCGGQLLADPGEPAGENCIHPTHPNGGGLRRLLQVQGYEVHEASYGSGIGQDTDLFDWLPKFRDRMDRILACDHQDRSYPDGRRNQVILFKSCFPNNLFTGRGRAPGNPAGPDLTLENAKSAYRALLQVLARRPRVLFVVVTAPPLAGKVWPERLGMRLLRLVLGRPSPAEKLSASGLLAREFNNWLKAGDGWLEGYPGRNVVVFDYFHHLTGGGASNFLRYPTGGGGDSHPSREGNGRAARAFIPLLNRAVRRAGL